MRPSLLWIFLLGLVGLCPLSSYAQNGSGAGSGSGSGQPPATKWTVVITAHPDDWQLFMGAAVCEEAQRNRRKIILICLTGGQFNEPSDTYWRGREAGHLASVRKAVDLGSTATPGASVPTLENIVVNGHSIEAHRYQNTISCYLHLPDGGLDGKGLVRGGGQSLKQLREIGKPLNPLDGGAPYTSWNDLKQTIRALLVREAVESGKLSVHCPQPDLKLNPIDHSDHRLAGLLAQDATVGLECRVLEYLGYTIARNPVNLTVAQQSWQIAAFRAYCQVMDGLGYASGWNDHLKFVGREYAQIRYQTGVVLRPPMPVPTATPDEDDPSVNQLVMETSYPNPMTVSSLLVYHMVVEGSVWLRILDGRGQVVQQICKGEIRSPGRHEQWLGTSKQLESGMYIAELRVGDQRRLSRFEVVR